MQHVMPDGNTAALTAYQLEQDKLYQEWEANEPQREYEIQQKTEELMHNQEQFLMRYIPLKTKYLTKNLYCVSKIKKTLNLVKKLEP